MNRLTVTIDPRSGFCFGVINATRQAEEILARGEKLYCLGELVHNSAEIERMKALGLIIIDIDVFSQLSNVTVLIRAHGEPPATYQIAKEKNIQLIDATCPVVLNLQKKVRDSSIKAIKANDTIVIFGKKGHAEVEGIVGQTDGKAIVVSSPDEVEHAVLQGDVYLFSQTTMGKDEYENVAAQLAKKIGSDKKVVKTNSICGQVSRRIPWAVELASKNDVVVFVSGKNSSNGKMLYQHCLAVNPSTYFVCEPAELRPEWFENSTTVGVCGATSTPLWQLEKIADAIRGLTF